MPTAEISAVDVERVIADVLGVEPHEVTAEKTWFGDLDGESIELLELTFHCERAFRVKVDFRDLMGLLSLEEDAEGRLTPAALAMLAERFPHLALGRIADNPRRSRLREAVTVGSLSAYVLEAAARQHGVS